MEPKRTEPDEPAEQLDYAIQELDPLADEPVDRYGEVGWVSPPSGLEVGPRTPPVGW